MIQSLQSAARIGREALVAGITLLLGTTGTALAQEGRGAYGGGMMDSSWGMFGGWGFLWLFLLVGVVVLVVPLISGNERTQRKQPDQADEELRKQYARGELSGEEFEKRRRKLQPTTTSEENSN